MPEPTPYDKDIAALAARAIEPDGAFGRRLTVLRARQEAYREGLAVHPHRFSTEGICQDCGVTVKKGLEAQD